MDVKDMTVADLIKILKRFDGGLKVSISLEECTRLADGYYREGDRVVIYG